MRTKLLILFALLGLIGGLAGVIASDQHDFVSVCQEDIKKFCKEMNADQKRTLRCLRDHKDEVSPHCKQETQRFRKLRQILERMRRKS